MDWMKEKAGIIIGSVLLAGALLVITRSCGRTLGPALSPLRFVGLGQVLAQETVRAVHDHGRVVVVMDAQRYNDSYSQLWPEWRSFQEELKRHPSINVTIDVVPVDLQHFAAGAGCSADQFKQLLGDHSSADAIVFLMSLPDWSLVEPNAPTNSGPVILVGDNTVVGTKTHYGGYFRNALLSVLITQPAGSQPTSADEPQSPRAAFDRYFQITTPENFQSLPD